MTSTDDDGDDDERCNSYQALRAAKIARNEARLKELGLLNFQKGGRSRKRLSPEQKKKEKGIVPSRRSARISGQPIKPSYITEAIDRTDNLRRQSVTKRCLKGKLQPKKIGRKLSQPAANSVRLVSLDVRKIIPKFLCRPLEIFGKDYVIQTSFRESAYPEDVERLGGITSSRLSFNKYSGVQEWKNVVFLWINIVEENTDKNSFVNDFSRDGKQVSWYGGSRMVEDSPIIQKLIQMGKECTTSTSSACGSRIILWCRHHDPQTRKLLPYTCLGRLTYVSHVPGSYPVAFTWKLLDYASIIGNQARKDFFQEVTHVTIS